MPIGARARASALGTYNVLAVGLIVRTFDDMAWREIRVVVVVVVAFFSYKWARHRIRHFASGRAA